MPSLGKFVQSKDGTKIWTHAAGNPAKPAVVFIPGFSCTALAFEKQFDNPKLLENLYLVGSRDTIHWFLAYQRIIPLHQVRYDPRGQGQSGQPLKADDYHTERYADDFKAVVDEYKLRKPFVCGWCVRPQQTIQASLTIPLTRSFHRSIGGNAHPTPVI